ncbi:protein OBERON 4-like [Triticum dicoccoides]|uniref:protein OBERON 4-like n=1 Tax=Triticum dicoccoides TaxID=85692 RepID=UPI0018906558|nr:protein OBERON 4-like [Triticum dicoccoides]
MKRQRSSYVDDDDPDGDRRRFYDRGGPPSPLPPRRRPAEYESDEFDRRTGFGGGRFYDHRYRDSPSPRGYGGDRAMHRSESFSGFRREFPKGFRADRDRSRWDASGSGSGGGGSAWRRPGGPWRDPHGLDGHKSATRRQAPSPPTPPRRSPSEPRRRIDGPKGDKLRKHNCGAGEIEEGEVAPDPDAKAPPPPSAAEHQKWVDSGRPDDKGTSKRCELKKVDSPGPRLRVDLRTQAADNLGKEKGKISDDAVAEAGKVTNTQHEKSASDVTGKVANTQHEKSASDVTGKVANTQHEKSASVVTEKVANAQHEKSASDVMGKVTNTQHGKLASDVTEKVCGGDEAASAVDQGGQSTSSAMQLEARHDAVVTRQDGANAADVGVQSTSSGILKEATMEEVETTMEEVTTEVETAIAVNDVEKGTSSSIQKESLQEVVMALGEAASDDDIVWIGSSSTTLQKVLPKEATDGNVNGGGGVGNCASSSILQGAMQEEVKYVDVAANIADAPKEVSSFSMPKEVVHEDDTPLTANTINLLGDSNSSVMLEEAMHETVTTKELTANAPDVAGKSSSSTMLQEDVMTSLCQESQEIKETEIGNVGDKKIDETTESIASQPVEEGLERYGCENRVALDKTEVVEEKEEAVENEIVAKQVIHVDLEAKLAGTGAFLQPSKDHIKDTEEEGTTLDLIMEKPRAEDIGKGIAFDVLNKAGGGTLVGRGFDIGLQPDTDQKEAWKSTSTTSGKQEDDTLKIGRLDLSLSLSGGLQDPEFKSFVPRPDSVAHGPCSQLSSSSSSFCTNSDGITASVSLTNSQAFVRNPSFSHTQRSLDNCEHSVGSKPLFQGVDQVSNSTGWQVELSSNISTEKGNPTPLLQKALQNGHLSDSTLVGVNMQNNGLSPVLSTAHNHGSLDAGLGHSRHRRQLTRERSSSSLSRGELQHEEQLVLNGAGVVERVISKIVSDPLNYTGRMLQEMTGNSRAYLREAISEIIINADKRGQIVALQEALKKRSDLNSEILQRCPRVLLEILVAIRTGLPDFLKKSNSIATPDLVDIFLNLKCRNLSCQSILPVVDCDCKICKQKNGFCSSCMCIVCLKFDTASNTCSWVGCDVCLHWCHTDCGLRHSLIRKGGAGSRAHGTNEMQFHCGACGHPSEMYGFVKEVFRTCAKQWRVEALIRELQYVERIFSASDDARGRRVRDFVKQMLIKLENRGYYSEVIKYVIAFFSDDNPNMGSGPLVPLKGIPCSIAEGINGIPSSSRTATWLPSVTLEGVPFLQKAGVVSTTGSQSMPRKIAETGFQVVNNKPVSDELDGLVRLKQAEANMYQERANEARKEAESLKNIVMVKYARIEEHYATQMSELHINELQERRKQNIEELQVIERSYHQFLSMKTRMKDNIRELLLKMEATKQNLST